MRAWDEDGAAPVATRCLPCALSPSTRLKVGPRTQPPKLARHRLELADHDHVHELPLRVGLCLDKNFAIAKSMKPSENYRPDIDGLRAVSILLVVGYHAHPWMLPGGFVGVDVFFVISGFLITRILLTPGGISLAAFYGRRIKRIFPALDRRAAGHLCARIRHPAASTVPAARREHRRQRSLRLKPVPARAGQLLCATRRRERASPPLVARCRGTVLHLLAAGARPAGALAAPASIHPRRHRAVAGGGRGSGQDELGVGLLRPLAAGMGTADRRARGRGQPRSKKQEQPSRRDWPWCHRIFRSAVRSRDGLSGGAGHCSPLSALHW
ncbi:hypothetical protein ACVWW4_004967 [Bradyrhizobium sp. LB7.1]